MGRLGIPSQDFSASIMYMRVNRTFCEVGFGILRDWRDDDLTQEVELLILQIPLLDSTNV